MWKRRKFGRHGGEQDFELNLASVIDCLTVLIAFLLVSTSFVSIGILDAEVATAGPEAQSEPQLPVGLQVELKADKSIRVVITGELERVHLIAAKGAQSPNWDFDALTDRLAILKGEWPALNTAMIVADNRVDYRDVIRSMEITRKAVPNVNLGGF